MKKRLYAHVILDRSGSMESCRDSTIDAFNEYVGGLAKDENVSARVSLTIFDDQSIDLIRDNIKAKLCAKLDRTTYVPRGMTPLNDAIGKTVAKIDAETRREGENVALVILTDGMENASREFKKDAIKALLDGRQKDKKWLVLYLGANQDAFAEGSAIGTQAHATMNFSTANVGASMKAAARSSLAYGMSGDNTALGAASFTDEERRSALVGDGSPLHPPAPAKPIKKKPETRRGA